MQSGRRIGPARIPRGRTGVTEDPDQLLTSHEVAAIFRVNERTVRRWHQTGQLDDCAIYTPGGQLRYNAARIRARANPPAARENQ
jgi:hypothetical protein